MGILNVTPDSFSDGGDHETVAKAVAAGLAMIQDGSDILDVGGETTQPGAAPTSPTEECLRVVPVIMALRGQGVPISIDTRNATTMAAALDAGATIVNDVSGLAHDPMAAPLVARLQASVVLMHMRGTPDTMTGLARYADVAAEVTRELRATVTRALDAGIAADRVALDPGIGFAKSGEQNHDLLRGLPQLAALGFPLVVGVSRKRFIGHLTGEPPPKQREAGSLAAALFAVSRGARIVRVHDVRATVQALQVWHALAR